MARMHIRRKGKSHSTRPVTISMPRWLRDKPEVRDEVDQVIEDLAKRGTPPSMIGLILRDKYGVPTARALYNKKLVRVLRERGLAPKIPEDLMNLIKRAVRINEHLRVHRKDVHNKRRLQLVEAKIKRLAKYYKRVGRLPKDWRYDRETASYLVARA